MSKHKPIAFLYTKKCKLISVKCIYNYSKENEILRFISKINMHNERNLKK